VFNAPTTALPVLLLQFAKHATVGMLCPELSVSVFAVLGSIEIRTPTVWPVLTIAILATIDQTA